MEEDSSQLDQDESESGQDMEEMGEDDQQLDDDAEYDDEDDDGEMGNGDDDGDESSLYNEASSYGYEDDDDSSKGKYSKKGRVATPNNLTVPKGTGANSSNVATSFKHNEPQNEKTIKKNKVIELYTNGERCVRRLSNLTGVPLTTVYRVIGKLKGINYNIPRGNGAGRKTILDSQDREILVNILNTQPRISRKALGKELEKLTGKSIHNSTLNRELCRLRHHGPSSVAASVLVRGSAASAAALAAARAAEEQQKSAHEASKTNLVDPQANKTVPVKAQSKPVPKQQTTGNYSQHAESSNGMASRLDQISMLKETAIKYCARLTEEDCKYNFEHIMPEYMKPIVVSNH